MGDLDPSRVGRARPIELSKASIKHTVQRLNNWTIVSSPNEGWAEKVFGEPDVERLWEAVAYTVRLDEEDPVAAWEAHREHLDDRAARLNNRDFDALRFNGPGTDLPSGCFRSPASAPGRSPRPGEGSTSRTCRRRRSSRPPTAGGRRALSARPVRYRSRASWSRTSS